MSTYIERGESLFIPFRKGKSISDSQCKPRMYKSVQNFEKTFPKHNYETKNIELVEYAEVKHGEWIYNTKYYSCSICAGKRFNLLLGTDAEFCPYCGAKMEGGNAE